MIYFIFFGAYFGEQNVDQNQILLKKIEKNIKELKNQIYNEKIEEVKHHQISDNDHPKEEIKRANQQNRQYDGKIQINAPITDDLQAPGIFFFKL